MHTPYGATEALPVSTIDAREILGETAAMTSKGAGVCVGRKFETIEWRVIRITDEPIASIDDAEELPIGEIGELIVCGDQVSPLYLNHPVPSPQRGRSKASTGDPKSPERSRGSLCEATGRGEGAGYQAHPPSPTLPSRGREPEGSRYDGANALAKIPDGPAVWHRMGDVGYLDAQGRFWYCGRKSHRVETRRSSCYSAPYEEVFNAHPRVKRSALVGVGAFGAAQPVLVVELVDGDPARNSVHADDHLTAELQQLKREHLSQSPEQRLTKIEHVLVHPSLPVDVRHNAKINREALATWAATQLEVVNQSPP
jgi:acyl-CoA synthetase (AMP-forming)/AMP-acid ligase II